VNKITRIGKTSLAVTIPIETCPIKLWYPTLFNRVNERIGLAGKTEGGCEKSGWWDYD